MALFCSPHTGFYGFVRSQQVLVVMKPNSSLFIVQRNNEESRNHMAPVLTFPTDNKNDVFLTVLVTASSRAANLIPMLLLPKPLLMALGKFKSRFPGSIISPQSVSEEAVDELRCINTAWHSLSIWHQRCHSALLVVPLHVRAYRRLCTSVLIRDPTFPMPLKNTFKSLSQ